MWKKALYVFLISILPIIELRGAIPVGAALELPFYLYAPLAVFGNLLPVPFILLFIPKILDLLERVKLFRPIIRWVREKADRAFLKLQKYRKNEEEISGEGERSTIPDEGASLATEDACPATEEACLATEAVSQCDDEREVTSGKKLSLGAFLGLLLFVMIPLPGTGAWTGSLVASLFDFPKRQSLLAITLGVLGACVIMTLASEGVVSVFQFFM